MIFFLFMGFVIVQRLIELYIARKNEQWMKEKGAIEFGREHYRRMVLLHVSFFVSIISEVLLFTRGLSSIWQVLLVLFVLTQLGRIWALTSLGRFWNTKIIVLPGARVIKKGPYKYVKHPNYVIVALEIIIISLLFNAFITGVLFTFLNAWMMSVRIPEEENALKTLTNYEKELGSKK